MNQDEKAGIIQISLEPYELCGNGIGGNGMGGNGSDFDYSDIGLEDIANDVA